MKKIILIALIGVLFLSMVYAYTPVPYNSANLTLTADYTPVVYYSANLTMGEAITDTCSPSSPLTADHIFECRDRCNITSEIDAGGYDILINGTGTFTTTVNITNVGDVTTKGTDNSNICEVYCLDGGCFV